MASRGNGNGPGGYSNLPGDGGKVYITDVEALTMRVERVEADIREVKGILQPLAIRMAEIHAMLTATLPTLATKAELAEKPSKLYIWGVFGVVIAAFAGGIAAIAALLPYLK